MLQIGHIIGYNIYQVLYITSFVSASTHKKWVRITAKVSLPNLCSGLTDRKRVGAKNCDRWALIVLF